VIHTRHAHLLLRLIDIGRARIGLGRDMQRTATYDGAPAGCDAEFGKGHLYRHNLVLFIKAAPFPDLPVLELSTAGDCGVIWHFATRFSDIRCRYDAF
jgi:hypothetical protein